MKGAEVPKGVLIGLGVVVLLVVGYFLFSSTAGAPAPVDPTTIPADRLLDPDPRGSQ
jgi:hypothetical protein